MVELDPVGSIVCGLKSRHSVHSWPTSRSSGCSMKLRCSKPSWSRCNPCTGPKRVLSNISRVRIGPVDEDRIHAAVKNRRVILLKAVRQLVQNEKVERTGTGKKGDPYRYQNA